MERGKSERYKRAMANGHRFLRIASILWQNWYVRNRESVTETILTSHRFLRWTASKFTKSILKSGGRRKMKSWR